MNLHHILSVLTVVSGIAMAIGYYPQAYRLWKAKNAEAMSLLTYGIFAAGNGIWLAYSVENGDWAMTIPFLIGAPGSWLVLALIIWHRRRKRP